MKLSSQIKIVKSKIQYLLDLVVDPEKPFDISFKNILISESQDPPFSAHIKELSQDLNEETPETWLLVMVEPFISTALDSIHDRTQMMQTSETHFYRQEIKKLMNFDESNLKVLPQLDSSIKTKFLGIYFNCIEVAKQKNQRLRSISPHVNYQMQIAAQKNQFAQQQQLQQMPLGMPIRNGSLPPNVNLHYIPLPPGVSPGQKLQLPPGQGYYIVQRPSFPPQRQNSGESFMQNPIDFPPLPQNQRQDSSSSIDRPLQTFMPLQPNPYGTGKIVSSQQQIMPPLIQSGSMIQPLSNGVVQNGQMQRSYSMYPPSSTGHIQMQPGQNPQMIPQQGGIVNNIVPMQVGQYDVHQQPYEGGINGQIPAQYPAIASKQF